MKAILLDHVGGPESLRYGDAPKPRPADKQLLVKVFATAVTPTEFAGIRPFILVKEAHDRFPSFSVMNFPESLKRSGRRPQEFVSEIPSMDSTIGSWMVLKRNIA